MPEPGSDSRCAASHAARWAGLPAFTTDSRSDSRSSPPRSTSVSPAADAQLARDVVDHAVVGGGGGGQHRDVGAEFGDQGADPAVVGTEVVAPVRHAVRLVDHDQAGVGGQRGQHLVAEVGIVQPFRADQQDVEFAVGDPRVDVVPVGDVARVDGRGAHPGPLGGGHLVAHQRQQRRHDDRRAVPVRRAAAWRR